MIKEQGRVGQYLRVAIYAASTKLPKLPSNSHRYGLFQRQPRCVFCGIEGVFIAKERDWTAQKGSKFHFNLYAITPDGKEVQMTKDHIIPKSLGGPNHPDNYQTACATCNKKKGNDIRFNLLTNNVSRERIQF